MFKTLSGVYVSLQKVTRLNLPLRESVLVSSSGTKRKAILENTRKSDDKLFSTVKRDRERFRTAVL